MKSHISSDLMFEWQNFSTALAVLELAWIALAPARRDRDNLVVKMTIAAKNKDEESNDNDDMTSSQNLKLIL